MSFFADTLWDLLKLDQFRKKKSAAPTRPARSHRAQARYDELVQEMKLTWNIRVHKWRSSTSGCAWEVRDRKGTVGRLIESPYPRGPMSCVVFLHEVGHHAIGFGRYKPRCLEEYKAWEWALAEMEQRGFNITKAVQKRHHDAIRYAVAKACRRGIKRLPAELVEYLPHGMHVQATEVAV